MVIANGNAWTPDDVRSALLETAGDLGPNGWDSQYGYGLVNASLALAWTTTMPPLPDPDPDPDPDPAPAPMIHVGDISLSSENRGGRCRVSGSVSVLDESGAGVSDATVSVRWSGAYNADEGGSTDNGGIASFLTPRVRGCGEFTLTVNDVSKEGYVYDMSQNAENSETIVTSSSRR
jgi:hypothetical protein